MRGDMKVVTHPDKAPALDFLTRTSVGPFVDTGIDVTLRSRPGDPLRTERVYLSEATIIQLAQLLGGLPLALVDVADGADDQIGHLPLADEGGVLAALGAESDDAELDLLRCHAAPLLAVAPL